MNIVNFLARAALAGLVCLPAVPARAEGPDVAKVLLDSDRARGGSIEGIQWMVSVVQFENEAVKDEIRVEVKASSVDEHLFALVSFEHPSKYRGRKLLLRDHNMWFTKEGLRKPVPISTRQRLSGSASNADIASANYVHDYEGSLLRTEDYKGTPSYVLRLTAKGSLVTYPRVDYWVSVDGHLGLRAQFFGSSGKMIKEAYFDYANELLLDGTKIRFVSKVTIVDRLVPTERTELSLSQLELKDHKRSTFQVESL